MLDIFVFSISGHTVSSHTQKQPINTIISEKSNTIHGMKYSSWTSMSTITSPIATNDQQQWRRTEGGHIERALERIYNSVLSTLEMVAFNFRVRIHCAHRYRGGARYDWVLRLGLRGLSQPFFQTFQTFWISWHSDFSQTFRRLTSTFKKKYLLEVSESE